MNRGIVALAFASFAMGTEAFVYAGHLDPLAKDLNVSVAAAGQLASSFALTYAMTAPIIAYLVSRFERRSVVLWGLVGVGVFNLAAILVPNLNGLIGLRILCGLFAGLVGPMSNVLAAEIVPEDQRSKAMAIVLGGVTLAFILGIPMGSVIGDYFGWRGTFGYAGLLSLLAAVLCLVMVPKVPGSTATPISAFTAAFAPPILALLFLTLIGFAATFAAVAYVGPLVTAITGLSGSGVGAIQAVVGLGSIIGIVIGGRFGDGRFATRILWASFLVSALALSVYTLQLANGPSRLAGDLASPTIIGVLALSMVVGSSSLFARIPIIQTKLAGRASSQIRPVVFALNGSMVFFGQGLGAVIGGLSINWGGLVSVGLVAAVLSSVGAIVAFLLQRTMTAKTAAVPS